MTEWQIPDIQNLKLFIYRRPLHPELFTLFLEKKVSGDHYEASLGLIGGGHLVSFHHDNLSLCELLTPRRELLPEKGKLEEFDPAKGKNYQVSYENKIFYMVNMEVEEMSAPVFNRVHDEMVKFAQNRGIFMPFDQWAEDGELSPFGFIDYDRRPSELDVFSYHAFPHQKIMFRTQSIFSVQPITTQFQPFPGGPFGKIKP
jgi:hypothetical protein